MELLDPPTDPELEVSRGAHRRTDDHPAPQEPRRRLFGFSHALWGVLAIAVCAVVATLLILRDAADSTHTPADVPVVPVSTSAPPPVADLPEGSFAGDGGPGDVQVYVVGKHIQPGSYTTAGALDPKATPRWETLRFRSEGDVPRRYRGGEPIGPVTVTLEIGDIFETTGYRPWARTPEAEEE